MKYIIQDSSAVIIGGDEIIVYASDFLQKEKECYIKGVIVEDNELKKLKEKQDFSAIMDFIKEKKLKHFSFKLKDGDEFMIPFPSMLNVKEVNLNDISFKLGNCLGGFRDIKANNLKIELFADNTIYMKDINLEIFNIENYANSDLHIDGLNCKELNLFDFGTADISFKNSNIEGGKIIPFESNIYFEKENPNIELILLK